MGFIGLGTQGRGLLNNFLWQPSRVVAVCDVDTTRRDDAKKIVDKFYSNSDCAAYNDFREIISRSDIDAVCIATPDHWHAVPTLAALNAGKDVYCEKPLTHNIHEAVKVIKPARAKTRIADGLHATLHEGISRGLRIGAQRRHRHRSAGGMQFR